MIIIIITGVLLAVGVASWVMRLSHAVTYGAFIASNILSGVDVTLLGGGWPWFAAGNAAAAALCAYAWWDATKQSAS